MRKTIFAVCLLAQVTYGQKAITHFPQDTKKASVWVDSVYNQMNFDQKVGQLFMVAAYSNKNEAHVASVEKLITENQIGGVIFFQGGPGRQARITNRLQSKSKLPLFVGIDAEWGLAMRLDSTYRFPFNMSLGAIQNPKLLEKLGNQMAAQAKRLGIHFNFAPVLDINSNPLNPIIGNRSFGENKYRVTTQAIALMKGIQKNGVFATGKHFPGHGDTNSDSHHTLPFLATDKKALTELELYPYRSAIQNGMSSVMVAHLDVPALEPTKGVPTSLSYATVTELLKEDYKFDGLIFTDALNMKGASNFKAPGDIDLAAFLAGNDVMLFAENVPLAVAKFRTAFEQKKFTEDRLMHSVKKILLYKYLVGLNNYKPIETKNIAADLNDAVYDDLSQQLYDEMITIAKKETGALPIRNLEAERIAYVAIGDGAHQDFENTLKSYTRIDVVEERDPVKLLEALKGYTKVIIGYHKEDGAWKKNDFTAAEIQLIQQISASNDVILSVFARPYTLLNIKDYSNINNVIVGYQNHDFAQIATAEVIFGALGAKGELPVSIHSSMPVGTGFKTTAIERLGYAQPGTMGFNPVKLNKIDDLAKQAIANNMTPGLQILVAKEGKIVYEKSFGYHEYNKNIAVKNTDVYDLASLTKILSTLPNMMQAYEEKRYTLDTTLGELLPVFNDTDKKDFTVRNMMLHQAGFQPWIAFYKATLDANNKPSEQYYRKTYSPDFPMQVSENLFLRKDYNDTLISAIAKSPVLAKKQYKYSDFTFILFKEYLEKTYGKSLAVLSNDKFYSKLGATTMTYNPLQKMDLSVIPPTEQDNYFRYEKVQGYVHDMAAAMQNGVAGHAGLFGSALDVAKVMQMYLNGGRYGGQQFIKPETLEAFNTCYDCSTGNRRGLGFDKPQLGNAGPTCGCASKKSFGHTGFTGTMTWVDPENGLLYVFISNRSFPDSNTNKLSKHNVRENIQQVIYDALKI